MNGSNGGELECTVADDAYPLIPDGEYEAVFLRYEKARFHGSTKLYVWFRIIEGQFADIEIFRAYNYYEPLRRGSDLCRDLVRLYGHKPPKGVRLPLKLFREKVLKVKVRTVSKTYKQLPMADHERYSVIDHIVSVETRNGI